MNEQLLASLPSVASASGRQRLPRMRGGDDFDCLLSCVGPCAGFIFLIVMFSISSLSPNEYGLYRSYLSGTISKEVVRGGIHLTGPLVGFIKFPATQMTLTWASGGDRRPIKTRTGADPNDPDSGGQPISITCAVQYKFMPETLPKVYFAFAGYAGAKQRFLLMAGNMVSNTAQEFTPQAFWKNRDDIAERMLYKINQTLVSQHVVAVRFEMMKIDFAKSFESSITAVQVAEQQRVVNEYEQQVQRVVQSIEVLRADNDALIANISAGAQAEAKEVCAHATRDAFHMKQARKAQKYKELQDELGFTMPQMQEYFKIKSVQGQGANGKVVVGLPKVGGGEISRRGGSGVR